MRECVSDLTSQGNTMRLKQRPLMGQTGRSQLRSSRRSVQASPQKCAVPQRSHTNTFALSCLRRARASHGLVLFTREEWLPLPMLAGKHKTLSCLCKGKNVCADEPLTALPPCQGALRNHPQGHCRRTTYK